MKLSATLVLGLLLGPIPPASAEALGRLEFQSLLQRFVDDQYLKSFKRLGEEADFDHAHLLFDPRSPQRPVAILYHTQELETDASLDPAARNWLQWLGRPAIEDAARYARRDYPRTAYWDWFLQVSLPALQRRHTILDKMLDPALLGADLSESRQWVFTRIECEGPASDEASPLRIALPSGAPVCLSLAKS